MKATVDRRAFTKRLALGLGAASLPHMGAQTPARKLHIGHTSITWLNFGDGGGGRSPAGRGAAGARAAGGGQGGRARAGVGGGPAVDPVSIETIIRDVSSLGFWGVELFGNVPVVMEDNAALGQLLHKYNNLPLISIVASPNCGDPTQLKESIQTMVVQATAAKQLGARIVLMNASGGRRGENYNFNRHKENIANALNEASRAMADLGLQAVLHQHTDTLVEKRDEVYAIMDAVDTRVMKAGFDVGQLSKGGSDPVQIVKDFLPVIEHLHLKDWDGGPNYAQYCPLGRGKVDLPAILDLMEKKGTLKGMVMVELDPSAGMPLTALETAKIAKAYLQKLGYAFRT
jgi:inosose dehydratase